MLAVKDLIQSHFKATRSLERLTVTPAFVITDVLLTVTNYNYELAALASLIASAPRPINITELQLSISPYTQKSRHTLRNQLQELIHSNIINQFQINQKNCLVYVYCLQEHIKIDEQNIIIDIHPNFLRFANKISYSDSVFYVAALMTLFYNFALQKGTVLNLPYSKVNTFLQTKLKISKITYIMRRIKKAGLLLNYDSRGYMEINFDLLHQIYRGEL